MKERPILFSAPMVRAILAGTKNQTRRVVKPVGDDGGFVILDYGQGGWPYRSDDGDSATHTVKRGGRLYHDETPHACPYGQPGDRLWVRETWRIGAWDCDTAGLAIDFRADGTAERKWLNPFPDDNEQFEKYWMQCIDDCEAAGLELTVDGGYHWNPGASPCRWRPSIHMPRWASRILLEITAVRVERLQDISEADAQAEGVYTDPACPAYDAFVLLWKAINGAGSWDSNPWVWVVEFKRVTPKG